MQRILGVAALLLPLVCAGAEPTKTPAAVPEGKWGGTGILVEVGPAGATIELDAAHGRIDKALLLDAAGRFDVEGTLVRQRPGPTHQGGEKTPADPVRYRGTLESDTLAIEILFPGTATAVGPLKAKLGAPARLRKMA